MIIILETNGRLKSSINFYLEIINKNYDIHLIISSSVADKLDQEILKQIKHVITIIPDEDINMVFEKISTFAKNNKIHIATNDEFILQDYYYKFTGDTSIIKLGPVDNKASLLPLFDKKFAKKLLQNNHINIANDVNTNKLDKHYPIVIKPKTGAGSCGVKIIKTCEDLKLSMDLLDSNDYIVEEYIAGSMYHYDAVLDDNKCIFEAVSKYNVHCGEFVFNTSNIGSITLPPDSREFIEVAEFATKCITTIVSGYSGACHIEIIRNTDSQFYFLEFNARAPGAMVPEMYKEAYGIDIQALHYMAQWKILKQKVDIKNFKPSAWIWFAPQNGSIKNVIKPHTSEVISFYNKVNIGDVTKQAVSIRDRIGGLLLSNKSFDELQKQFQSFSENNKVFCYE